MEGRKWMTALLPAVTTRSKNAVCAAANHLTTVTTGVAAAARITGVANLADTSTVLTATNAAAWKVTQWDNATHPATTTFAATRNARTAGLVAIAATLASATTAGHAAATVTAETARSYACAAVAKTGGGGAGAAVVATARNDAATGTTVEPARNVAVPATAAPGLAKNAVTAAATASTARVAGAAVDTIAAKNSAPRKRRHGSKKGRSEQHQQASPSPERQRQQ